MGIETPIIGLMSLSPDRNKWELIDPITSHSRHLCCDNVFWHVMLHLATKVRGCEASFHQPRFPWTKGVALTKPPFFSMRSCEVAIIWPDWHHSTSPSLFLILITLSKLTWLAGKSPCLIGKFNIFNLLFFHCHVSFPGCTLSKKKTDNWWLEDDCHLNTVGGWAYSDWGFPRWYLST